MIFVQTQDARKMVFIVDVNRSVMAFPLEHVRQISEMNGQRYRTVIVPAWGDRIYLAEHIAAVFRALYPRLNRTDVKGRPFIEYVLAEEVESEHERRNGPLEVGETGSKSWDHPT